MPVNCHIADKTTGEDLSSSPVWTNPEEVNLADRALQVVDPRTAPGVFKSVTHASATTTQLVSPVIGGSVMLTDILISGEKQAGSEVTVQFTDGASTETIFLASQVDAPPTMAHQFLGRFQGWVNANLEVVTSGTGKVTVTLGYIKLCRGLPYGEWDKLR